MANICFIDFLSLKLILRLLITHQMHQIASLLSKKESFRLIHFDWYQRIIWQIFVLLICYP